MSPQPDIQVCLDCGNAEFVIPEKWLSAGWLQAQRSKMLRSAFPRRSTKSAAILPDDRGRLMAAPAAKESH